MEGQDNAKTITKHNFSFVLEECKKYNNNVICYISIKNIEKETRDLDVCIKGASCDTTLIIEGKRFYPSQGEFENSKGTKKVYTDLLWNINTPLKIIFPNIHLNTKKIDQLQIHYSETDKQENFSVSFKNIHLTSK